MSLRPVSYEAPVSDVTVEPVDEGFAAAVFEVAPAAEPAGEAFAWSPWAQEMGLGEAPVSAAPEVVPVVGFADMVETERGHGHTDAFPVPQAPVSGVQAAEFAPVEFAPVEFAPVEFAAVEQPEVIEVAQFVPQPRDPGDGGADASAYVPPVGAHAASDEHVAETLDAGAAHETPAGGEPAESAPDLLAGGLLAHLMSSVRGL